MTDLDPCPGDETLVDLALGELSGRERADALGHLVRCPRCREQVDALIDVTEQLLLVAPEADPPPGFESDVLARLQPAEQARRSPRRRRVLTFAAAAAVFVVALLAVLLVDSGGPTVAEAAMITPAGRNVGTAWSYDDERSWVLVSVPAWEVWEEPGDRAHRYRLVAELDDGSTRSLGDITFGNSDGSWGTTTEVRADRISAVAVVDETGRVWCEGRF